MPQTMLELRGIHKSFPGVKALDDVGFELRSGEVHALLGENGAGKSTLMKIISGIYPRDAGEFILKGRPVTGAITPRRAQSMGIAIIHQELNMCKHLTVAENIFLGREIARATKLKKRQMNALAAEYLRELEMDIDPSTVVSKLSVGGQQMIEIVKAISTNCDILIMDEPTSALTAREVEDLNRIIFGLKAKGVGIVYITHRLEELEKIADRVTILRDGKYVLTSDFKDITHAQIISNMVGRTITEKYPRVFCEVGETVFAARDIVGERTDHVSFAVMRGEIVGFAGLMGAGRTELMRKLFGIDPMFSGEVFLEGKKIDVSTPTNAIRAGIAFVPEDRKNEGLCVNLSVRENVALANLDSLTRAMGYVDRRAEKRITQKAIDNLKVRTPSQTVEAKSLSGGNQQKVVVGKWLVRNARFVIFDEPTRGIDVAAKVEIYQLMNQLKKNGIGIVFVSSEMPEILGMADRIFVMCEGRITGEFVSGSVSQDEIMRAATAFQRKEGA